MAYSTEYERLAPAVTSIGWLVSATAVIIFSFKGRANWEPSKQDLTPGPQRIAGFLTAIGSIGVIWKRLGYSAYNDPPDQFGCRSGAGLFSVPDRLYSPYLHENFHAGVFSRGEMKFLSQESSSIQKDTRRLLPD